MNLARVARQQQKANNERPSNKYSPKKEFEERRFLVRSHGGSLADRSGIMKPRALDLLGEKITAPQNQDGTIHHQEEKIPLGPREVLSKTRALKMSDEFEMNESMSSELNKDVIFNGQRRRQGSVDLAKQVRNRLSFTKKLSSLSIESRDDVENIIPNLATNQYITSKEGYVHSGMSKPKFIQSGMLQNVPLNVLDLPEIC